MDGFTLELPIFLLATFAGALVAGLSGFAFGLVAASLWLYILSPVQTATLIVAFGLIVQGYSVWKLRRALDWHKLWPFVAGAAIGVPLGVTLLTWADPHSVRVGVGIFLVLYSLYAFFRPTLKPVTGGGAAADAGVGFLNGVLAGITGLAGILVTIWSGLRGWPKDVQRAIFQPVAVCIFLMSALWLGAKGTVTPETIKLFVIGLPFLLAGTWLGLRLFGRIDSVSRWRFIRGMGAQRSPHEATCPSIASRFHEGARMSCYHPATSENLSTLGRAASCIAGFWLCAVQNHLGRKKEKIMKHPLTLFALGVALLLSLPAHAADIDWKKVDAALGKTAAVSGEVHRYGLPRSDLRVTLDGIAIKPALALGGWVAFAPMHGEAMVMGDLVLLDTEITPVMTKLLDSGLDITAIHNHILRAAPATFYMHVAGHGDPEKMAASIRAALSSGSKTPFDPPATTAGPAPIVDLDTAKLDEAMGAKGTANGGVYQFGIPRRDPATESGMPVSGALGGANAINFQPTGSGKAAITGDFLVTGDEVNPLIRVLRASDIEVTAIHSHMLDEQPRMFFIHFWANDDALKLARGVRAALDKTAVAQH